MKKSKRGIFIWIMACCLSLLMLGTVCASVTREDSTLKKAMNDAQLLHDQLRGLAQEAIGAVLNKQSTKETQNQLKVTHAKVEYMIEQTNSLKENVLEGSSDKHNIDLFQIVLGYLLTACDELSNFIKADNIVDQYDSLERYFYSIHMHQQSEAWLQQFII